MAVSTRSWLENNTERKYAPEPRVIDSAIIETLADAAVNSYKAIRLHIWHYSLCSQRCVIPRTESLGTCQVRVGVRTGS